MITFDIQCPYCKEKFKTESFPYIGDYKTVSIEAICPKCGGEFERKFSHKEADAWKEDFVSTYKEDLEKEYKKTLPKILDSINLTLNLLAKLKIDLTQDKEAKETLKILVEKYLNNSPLHERLELLKDVLKDWK